MKDANAIYAQSYNRKNARCGPLFQGRYKAYLIEKETYLLTSARYIVLNPVRAGICAHPSSWPFCSYRATAGLCEHPPFLSPEPLLSHFSSDLACARRRYREFISAGLAEEMAPERTGGVVLGGEELLARVKEFLEPRRSMGEIPKQQRFQDRPPLSEIFSDGTDRCIKSIRDEKVVAAFREYGYTQVEIGKHLGIDHSTVSLIIRTREKG